MKKSSRQALIKQIIEKNNIETQEELISRLKEDGVNATQATVSRDVREMGIVKGHSSTGEVRYIIIEQVPTVTKERLKEVIVDSVEQIMRVQFMVIIRTNLGSADRVAAVLDDLELEEIAGTLAGSDTVVIISHSNETAENLQQKLLDYLSDV